MQIVIIICTIASLIATGMYYHSKNHAVDMICKHPELSDEKVEHITKMISKRHKDFCARNNSQN